MSDRESEVTFPYGEHGEVAQAWIDGANDLTAMLMDPSRVSLASLPTEEELAEIEKRNTREREIQEARDAYWAERERTRDQRRQEATMEAGGRYQVTLARAAFAHDALSKLIVAHLPKYDDNYETGVVCDGCPISGYDSEGIEWPCAVFLIIEKSLEP